MDNQIARLPRWPTTIIFVVAFIACLLLHRDVAEAGTVQLCVQCTDPDKTYLCDVNTNNALQNQKGLQLFCIIRTSREGGHRSCSVDERPISQCSGEVKSYSFNAPQIPENVRRALAKRRSQGPANSPDPDIPPQKGGEPETLIEMTRGAVGASKEGIKNSGQAVGTAAGATKQTVGNAARGVGKGVTSAAGKVGSATKKTGSAVGSAAKNAWDCVKSLFKGCGSSQ